MPGHQGFPHHLFSETFEPTTLYEDTNLFMTPEANDDLYAEYQCINTQVQAPCEQNNNENYQWPSSDDYSLISESMDIEPIPTA